MSTILYKLLRELLTEDTKLTFSKTSKTSKPIKRKQANIVKNTKFFNHYFSNLPKKIFFWFKKAYRPMSSHIGVEPSNINSMFVNNERLPLSTSFSEILSHNSALKTCIVRWLQQQKITWVIKLGGPLFCNSIDNCFTASFLTNKI